MRAETLAALLAAALVFCPPPARLLAQEPTEGGALIDSLEVVGNRRVTRETIVNAAGIPLRTPVTYRDIQRAIRSLVALGQFDDIQVSRRPGDAGEEIVTFILRERPLLVRAGVRGVDKLSERAVRERIEIPNGRPLDPALVARARLRIDSLYEAEGYYLAEVRPVLVPQDSDAVRLVFDITEGRRVAIAAVRIEGNNDFTDGQVVKRMKTRPEGFWWFQQGEYSEDRLRQDLDERIPGFYGSRGYIDFRILRDTLLVDETSGKATLVVEVSEGRPYRVGTVTVDGNRYFSTDQVLSLNPFDVRPSAGLRCLLRGCGAARVNWFDQTAWDDATAKLRTQYANAGYIYAEVRPRIEHVESADTAEPPTVNLSWAVNEQHPAIVNRIEILGNEVTHERVIREALVILPGDVFAQDRVLRSYQNISNLGFFNQPLPFPDTRPANDQGDIDLVFRVEEKHTGNVNFGASVGQGTGVGGFLGLDEPNLFGQGRRGRLQWQFGRNINDFDISYTDPSLWASRVSGTASLHNTRIRYTIADLGRITTRGGSLQLGFPLPRSRYSRVFLSYGLEVEKYSGAAQNLTGSFRCADCLRSTVGLTFLRDTRIDLPFATGGSMHNLSANFTGGVLGGSATFQRYDLEGRWYAPAGRLGGGPVPGSGIRLVLGLTTKAGFVFGDAGPFFRQLFAMGGTQFGIPLRGYDEFAITPQGFNPDATLGGVPRTAFGRSYYATTVEFGARFSQQIYVSAFYDAGNVWASAAGFNPTRLFRGAGVGVALITPLGPLGVDYAYGFDRTDSSGRPAPGWKLHFKIGNFF
ncbi:MAG: outer membrane protein assembly factor BamA [Gemmatimonadetes bacterium GWC2_71_9]|nr:MAG: outer membrane protein assembly factor BamA [Gemmatimonadetes bacterium GWC2_71_9]